MARHKFASNVCEKALVCAPREEREMLIDELLIKPEGSVALLMKDQYGNYVMCVLAFLSDCDYSVLTTSLVSQSTLAPRFRGRPKGGAQGPCPAPSRADAAQRRSAPLKAPGLQCVPLLVLSLDL